LNNPLLYSVGTAVPPFRILQQEHHRILESANGLDRTARLRLHRIYSRSGIESRFSVLEEFGKEEETANVLFHPSSHKTPESVGGRMKLFEEFSVGLCRQAALKCFEGLTDFNVASVTHLITFTCTGLSAPGLDIQLVEELGLNRNVERTCINFMGCYAGINALKTAYHISRSQKDAVVLLCGVELCTLHYREYESDDQLIANALFADGAAAAIVSASEKLNPSGTSYELTSFYSEFEPSGKDEMVWRISEQGFDLKLSIYVPELIKGSIAALMEKLFTKSGIRKDEIDFFAIHPGGVKILEACEEALGVSHQQNEISYSVLRDYGNMSSVTLFFVLKKYMEQLDKKDNGKNMLACAFGPGLTVESMILKVR
jgi:alpha-pyrone synthase